jgi:hypothetical protein
MSLQTRLEALATRVGQEIKTLRGEVVTLAGDQTITGAKRFVNATLPHPPITRALAANPPANPQVDDLWIVPDADPAPAAPNFVVSPTNPGLAQGMWVQTGLGPTGQDYTIWIETGV